MTHAIRADALTKYFPRSGRIGLRSLIAGLPERDRFVAVDGVSLDVRPGEVMGILGRNGAGKSTLLRLVGGIYAPDGGSVAVSGDLAALFELGGTGNVQLTGREFAHRYLQLFGLGRRGRQDVVADIHEFSELGDYFDQKILTYSSGMAARLYFATATAIPHEVYLIDEILSVGDEHFQVKSWARVRERLGEGASGLLVTHDWSAVIRLCRRSAVMRKGRMVQEGRSDEIVAAYLALQAPAVDRARLLPPDEQALRAVSGQDYALRFGVEVFEPGEVQVAVSIEALQLGVGWEPVILTEFQPVAREPGRYDVAVRIPLLPLAAGEYSLNLFLASAPDAGTGERQSRDRRAWTYGNGLMLQVRGDHASSGLAPFPLQWQEVDV